MKTLDSPFAQQPSLRPVPTSTRTPAVPLASTSTTTTSTTAPPTFESLAASNASGSYNHIPPPLLHSMRESFDVIDSSASGSLTAAQLAETLTQLGLDAGPASLSAYFPPRGGVAAPTALSLARYLDTLAGPLAALSAPAELRAAFEAFDVDDSGQIDVDVLREAVLGVVGADGRRMGEREVESVLGDFSGRRAFGGKGMGRDGMGKGEVFRWREFMARVSGGTGMGGEAGMVG